MRLKRSSVPAGSPSASASSAKDKSEEKGKKFLTMAVQTLQDLYKRLVQRLDLANLTSTTKRNLKVTGIALLGLLVVLVALPFCQTGIYARRSAWGFILAIARSLRSAPCGFRVPCSQLRTVFGLTFRYVAKITWLALSAIRILRISAGFSFLGGLGSSITRRLRWAPPSKAIAS